MNLHLAIAACTFAVVCVTGAPVQALAQAAAPTSQDSSDPWPRQIKLSNAAVLIYQPQIEKWEGNVISMRAAIAIKTTGSESETFGSVFVTARTQVDRAMRTVVFAEPTITRSNFPALPDQGAAYAAEVQSKIATDVRTISLDRVEASLAAAGVTPPSFSVNNDPPRIIVTNSPAILVPVDGPPVIKPVPDDSRFRRVINTQALILQGGLGQEFYLHVYDGWLKSSTLDGPWTTPRRVPSGMDPLAQKLAQAGIVDLLNGGANANPKPSLANGVPILYVSQVPAELIVFKGQPNFVPVVGTPLMWASNTSNDVLVDSTNNVYYVLIAGRWFRANGLGGPWSFVASNSLPPGFARIPPNSPAGIVLASVAGTPQAQEAAIANSIPQTATIPRTNGPTFTPAFDGPPQYKPIEGTTMRYAANSAVPIIQVDSNTYYAANAGVWFTSSSIAGPWLVAASVPAVIYTIPTASPLHYVTYVRIYGSTPTTVSVGYTPGYMGTVVEPSGTVVYGTGYMYSPWIGAVWYPPPVTYGVAAVPVYNAALGYTYGFAIGLTTAAWATPYYGAAYHPYACCGTVSASVYGQYGHTAYAGTRSYSAGGGAVTTSASGTYYNKATGTAGTYQGGRSYNANTGVAQEGYNRTGTTAAGGSGEVSRGETYNTNTGQRSYGASESATGAGGSSVERTSAATTGPEGTARASQTTTTNARTGETNTFGTASAGNTHYADANGNVYKNTGNGWEEHGSNGWGKPSGETSSMDREAEARQSGEERAGGFARGGGGFAGGGGGRFRR